MLILLVDFYLGVASILDILLLVKHDDSYVLAVWLELGPEIVEVVAISLGCLQQHDQRKPSKREDPLFNTVMN